MIKVSVLYENKEGGKFDHDYYRDSHIPMIQNKLGSALQGSGIEKGLAGGVPKAKAPFVCIGHLTFNSVEDFQQAFGSHAEEIMADVPNYTDIEPTIQISEMV
jgi:uncharacterized protein (TIGR02118 family)